MDFIQLLLILCISILIATILSKKNKNVKRISLNKGSTCSRKTLKPKSNVADTFLVTEFIINKQNT